LIADATRGRDISIRLFDTFTGIPPTADGHIDFHKAGDFGDTSAEIVAQIFSDDPRVSVHAGLFPFTAGETTWNHHVIRLSTFDVDIYRSVMDCCGGSIRD